ncbi:dystroglycan-like [Dorcoceras hygrometricum]|uniref:Dystroglycan-like n=1 Tax=Dorcoceras hygrometricum TaxID=472368 RepID=A0A2Z7A7L6_9LAMI|nr:dystroglycan-like [Dorcoceras hygrometricum]
MASSFYRNSQNIDFDSVLAMDDPGMVSMFQALMASGLVGFLGCPAVIYEAALVDFFENASVREGVIISTVAGKLVEISEEWFAESFDLPVDGLSALSEITKDKSFVARSIVSLLAVVCGVRMNWARVLFNILKKMVTPGSKQAKGFAAQISLLLENISNLELGESSEFPASKILTEKTVHRYVSLNDKGGAKEAADAPLVKKEPQKRPVAADFEAPVIKNKSTMKKKSGSSKAFLEIVAVAQEAVPIQMVEPTTSEPAAEDEISADPPADEVAGETADVEAADEGSNEEPAAGDATRINEPTSEPAVTEFVNEESSTNDDVDIIIEQFLADTAQISVDEGEQVVRTLDEGNQPAGTAKKPHWFDLPYDDLIASWDAERPVVTASDTDEDVETMDVGAAGGDQQVQFSEEEPEDVEMSDDEQSVDELIDADEKMSLEDILVTIPVDIQLPSADIEITKITMGKEIKIPSVDEKTQYLASLPKIPVDSKGKAILVEKDPVKGNPAREHYSLICADIDLLVHLRAQVIDAYDQFFLSFSFKNPATINIEELSKKEEQVLCWGETETTHVALNRKRIFGD